MKCNERRILRAMVHNQDWLIRRMCHYERERISLTGRRLQRWIRRYRHRPLSMLGECYGRICPNNRLRFPWRRRLLERNVIEALINNYGEDIMHLQCIFFGSGGLLQEIFILSKVCAVLRMNMINVICCDREYDTYSLDEKVIIEARFAQAQAWMLLLAPNIQWTWTKVHSLVQMKLADEPTLFVATDVAVPDQICNITQWYPQNIKPLIFILDECGIMKNTFD